MSIIAILTPLPLIPRACTWSTPPIFKADEASKSGPKLATGKVPFQRVASALALLTLEVELSSGVPNGRGALTI